jgi:hypothetical protein
VRAFLRRLTSVVLIAEVSVLPRAHAARTESRSLVTPPHHSVWTEPTPSPEKGTIHNATSKLVSWPSGMGRVSASGSGRSSIRVRFRSLSRSPSRAGSRRPTRAGRTDRDGAEHRRNLGGRPSAGGSGRRVFGQGRVRAKQGAPVAHSRSELARHLGSRRGMRSPTAGHP